MSLLPVGLGSGAGYEIPKSLRFRAGASAYLSRTPSVAGSRRTWTWSGWVKRGALGVAQSLFNAGVNSNTTGYTYIAFLGDNTLGVQIRDAGGAKNLWSSAVFRDPSAHLHVLVAVDTDNATASLRRRIYVNGSEITSFSINDTLTQGTDTAVNQASTVQRLGVMTDSTGVLALHLDGYLSEINFIDGQALTPSSFGQTDANGVWQPKKYTGTYGTNGFYLPFNDGTNLTNLCLDRSGNGNNWTATNVSLTAGATYDWMDDTPSNNFAVLNPLVNTAGYMAYGSANLYAQMGAFDKIAHSGFQIPSSGKWYFEYLVSAVGLASNVGISDNTVSQSSGTGFTGGNIRLYFINGNKSGALPYGASFTTNDVIGVAVDMDAGTIVFYKNNVSQGTAFSDLAGGTWFPAVYLNSANGHFNFGQRPFAYTPPTGFKALCTKNLPVPVIQNPRQHFDVTTYTGTGASRSITGLSFSPDLVWMKSRGRAVDHALFDRVRGAQLMLESNQTGAETTESTGLTAFNSDGWTMGALDQINGTTATNSFVGWQWKAGGAAVTNTAGTITSQVSANTTAGFSIVTYTGTGANATVGHGLGVAPKMVIVKRRNGGVDWWVVLHTSANNGNGQNGSLFLQRTDAWTSSPTEWNSTTPSSSVFSVGSSTASNANGGTYVAYCFAEVPGFSRIGSYTGNGSADGPFVYCGFRPRWVMVKRTDVAGNWKIMDTARNPANVASLGLYPNLTNAEDVGNTSDLLSQGFKLRETFADYNASGGTYIFLAFAEAPFSYARGR